jgi:hypothetical protein
MLLHCNQKMYARKLHCHSTQVAISVLPNYTDGNAHQQLIVKNLKSVLKMNYLWKLIICSDTGTSFQGNAALWHSQSVNNGTTFIMIRKYDLHFKTATIIKKQIKHDDMQTHTSVSQLLSDTAYSDTSKYAFATVLLRLTFSICTFFRF